MKPRMLVATTTWWPLSARIALAFLQSGCEVDGIAPRGNPMERVTALNRQFLYKAINPLGALRNALKQSMPDLIIPCDDRVVTHLHQLFHAEALRDIESPIAKLIVRSLGDPSGYPVTSNRARLLQLAKWQGVRVPETLIVHQPSDIGSWRSGRTFPLVIKADGTWAGNGVKVAHNLKESEQAFRRLQKRLTPVAAIWHMSEHNFYPIFENCAGSKPEIIAQTYIKGTSANAMFACWHGKVVGSVTVRVIAAKHELGASTIVRTMHHPKISAAAVLIVKELNISGFCGLDFIIQEGTGTPFLIELNPRATQLGHLKVGQSADLAACLCKALLGETFASAPDPSAEETIAFFPQIPLEQFKKLQSSYGDLIHDIPREDAELTEELMNVSWTERQWSARLCSSARLQALKIIKAICRRHTAASSG